MTKNSDPHRASEEMPLCYSMPLFYHSSLSSKMIGRGQGHLYKKEIISVWMKIRTNVRFLRGEIMHKEQRIRSLVKLKWFPEAEAFPHTAGGNWETSDH